MESVLTLASVENNCVGIPAVVELNVGGVFYTTLLTTLTRYQDSLLANIFNDRQQLVRDGHGRYFIDRDGKLFRYILEYLRNDRLILPQKYKENAKLLMEAEYFQLKDLINELKSISPALAKRNDTASLPIEGYLTVSVRGTYAFGRDGMADIKFRKLQRIMVGGNVALVREVFGDALNESRDPDRDDGCYTTRFFLKHNQLEKAFDNLNQLGFKMVTSAAGGAGHDSESEETKWNHFVTYVFYRDSESSSSC